MGYRCCDRWPLGKLRHSGEEIAFHPGVRNVFTERGPEAVWEENGCWPLAAEKAWGWGAEGQAGTWPECPLSCPGAGIPDSLLQRAAWSHSCFRKTSRAAARGTVSALGLVQEEFHAGHCSGDGGLRKRGRADRAVCARWSEEGAGDQRYRNKDPRGRSQSGGDVLSSGLTPRVGGARGWRVSTKLR